MAIFEAEFSLTIQEEQLYSEMLEDRKVNDYIEEENWYTLNSAIFHNLN